MPSRKGPHCATARRSSGWQVGRCVAGRSAVSEPGKGIYPAVALGRDHHCPPEPALRRRIQCQAHGGGREEARSLPDEFARGPELGLSNPRRAISRQRQDVPGRSASLAVGEEPLPAISGAPGGHSSGIRCPREVVESGLIRDTIRYLAGSWDRLGLTGTGRTQRRFLPTCRERPRIDERIPPLLARRNRSGLD